MSDTPRRSYEESGRELLTQGWIEGVPPLLSRRPLHDDDDLGISFFRTELADADLSNMTLPRTFFGRSDIRGVSFQNTDLSESTLCWNDFTDVDFTGCRLEHSDLRAATFKDVRFSGADLRNADLRQATFEGCDFCDADLLGAMLTRAQGATLKLSPGQQKSVTWSDEDGDEPGGG